MRIPKEKRERSLGVRLGLKGDRCQGPKCVMVRRPYKPGVHGPKRSRRQLSDFGRQIREKQKFKVTYGINEKNLRSIFDLASKQRGSTSSKLLELLERRLDNVVFRAGFAPSRGAARKAVLQGHITVNAKKVISAGFQVVTGDVVSVKPQSLERGAFKELKETLLKHDAPDWIKLDPQIAAARIEKLPVAVESPFEVNMLVESFSK